MATCYGLPEGFEAPDFEDYLVDGRFDLDTCNKVEADFIESLRTWVKANRVGAGDLMGQLVHYPVADGSATYMVVGTNPCALMHIPLGDAWQIPEAHMRGLRTQDIRADVQRAQRIAALFAKSA